jgi:hypothetical protein
MNTQTAYENEQNPDLRDRLHQKLEQLSTEQLDSVWRFIKFIEDQQTLIKSQSPKTNEDIDRIVQSYRQQNKRLPIGLAKGELVIPNDFNEPLPDEILDLFELKDNQSGFVNPK